MWELHLWSIVVEVSEEQQFCSGEEEKTTFLRKAVCKTTESGWWEGYNFISVITTPQPPEKYHVIGRGLLLRSKLNWKVKVRWNHIWISSILSMCNFLPRIQANRVSVIHTTQVEVLTCRTLFSAGLCEHGYTFHRPRTSGLKCRGCQTPSSTTGPPSDNHHHLENGEKVVWVFETGEDLDVPYIYLETMCIIIIFIISWFISPSKLSFTHIFVLYIDTSCQT